MNAYDYLSQAYMLEQRIQTKLHHISCLRSLAQTVSSYTGGEPVSHTRNVTQLEDTVIKIMQKEHELNLEIDRLVDLKREIMEVLDEVKDLNYRLILEKRYLCFESWPKIGEDMGHSDRWAQLKHQAALRVVDAILAGRQERSEQTAG